MRFWSRRPHNPKNKRTRPLEFLFQTRSPSSSMAPTSTPPPRHWGSTSTTSGCSLDFRAAGQLVRAFYYTALMEDQEYSSIRPLIDWLDYNGYTMVTKPTKEFTDAIGRRKIKGNMDIELAVDAMDLADASRPHGVSSRATATSAARGGGAAPRRRVSVVSTFRTQPPMVADELRRQADVFSGPGRVASRSSGRDPAERPATARAAPALPAIPAARDHRGPAGRR